MKIIVTEEHIERGEKGSRKCCAIALAAAECECSDVDVGAWSIGYSKDGKRYQATLPLIAHNFILRFDETNLPVRPIEFSLDDIEEIYEDQS